MGTTATPLIRTLLFSEWQIRSTGRPTLTSDLPAYLSTPLEIMTSGCPLSQVGEPRHLVVPPAMEEVMLVRETQAVHLCLVPRTATVEPILDKTMTSLVLSPLE